jgi:hypothetical protein
MNYNYQVTDSVVLLNTDNESHAPVQREKNPFRLMHGRAHLTHVRTPSVRVDGEKTMYADEDRNSYHKLAFSASATP